MSPLTPTEIIDYRNNLKALYPFVALVNNLTTGFSDIEIDAQIPIAWDLIPSICKRKVNTILYQTTIHLLLYNRQDAIDFIAGETDTPSILQTVEVGDISLGMSGSDGDSDNVWWNSTKYGQRAYQLIGLCAKSRVGVMV